MKQSHGPKPARRRRTSLTKWASLLFLLSGACWTAFLVRTWRSEQPPPTSRQWHAFATIFAGEGSPGFDDGSASQSRFADPFGVAVDRWGNVYVADAGASNRIRKITPAGVVSTVAGGAEGFADGPGASASFNTPSAIALDMAGNLYVADTANNRIRKIAPDATVTTLAGDGNAGFRDGPAASAQFDAPVGVAVGKDGNVYVADTYNDRIRRITPGGEVSTLAGGAQPGYRDGPALDALLDTPCALAVSDRGELFIADTGNNRLRKLTPDGQITTLPVNFARSGAADTTDAPQTALEAPLGLALTHDGFLYVTEMTRGRIVQIAPDSSARVLAGAGSGFADGPAEQARFNRPAGLVVDRRGTLFVADAANYLLRKLAPAEGEDLKEKDGDAGGSNEGDAARTDKQSERRLLPHLTAEMLGVAEFPWPVDPQKQWHEVVATMGEVRGSFDGESRHHLHSGIDIPGPLGAPVRAVYGEKVASPLPNFGFGGLNEGMNVGFMTYVHMRVGRNQQDEPLDGSPFAVLRDAEGKATRVRVRRGTRLRFGDALGTINRMYHVHLNFGPWAGEINPLTLPFIGFGDHTAPTIEADGIQLFDTQGRRFMTTSAGRLVVRGDVHIVVDAYDQVDGNQQRRRLGLYKLGYQLLNADATPAQGFAEPRINLLFDRLPPQREAVRIAYADASGITVYGSAATKFLYVATNTVRDGLAAEGVWHASELPPGDYVLRIIAADLAGNEATKGRDLPLRIE